MKDIQSPTDGDIERGAADALAWTPSVPEVRRRIEAAFRQVADIDTRRITVRVHEHTVTSTGSVGSWAERRAAEHAALAVPGIELVEYRLAVVR
jgi:osmotically-inducible protein OsmY